MQRPTSISICTTAVSLLIYTTRTISRYDSGQLQQFNKVHRDIPVGQFVKVLSNSSFLVNWIESKGLPLVQTNAAWIYIY